MKNMDKRIIYIKPINLDDQIEDKINKNIPIKTEEKLSYFKNEKNTQYNLNDNYFQVISQRDCIHQKTKKLEKSIQLKNETKLKSFEKDNIINSKCLLQNKNNNNINLKNNNLDNETMKKIVNQRKCLHKIYAKDKRIINHTYKSVTPSKSGDKSYKQDKQIVISKINETIYLSNKDKDSRNNKKKLITNRKNKNKIKFGLYDPTFKSLKYKHYSDNFDNSIKSTLRINNSIVNKYNKYNHTIEPDKNKEKIYSNYINTISYNDINNNFNESLIKHRKENQQNLIRLRKLLFNNKRINYYINRKSEESKSNIIKNEKEIYKININEKIKNIINHERKKLEESIDTYNQKLEMNFNKKNILFKNYEKNKYITEINTEREAEKMFDNMSIISNFHFQRENKL